MKYNDKAILIQEILRTKVVSFALYDTLVFRMINDVDTVYELVGKKFAIHGFLRLRKIAQKEADKRMYQEFGYPHADIERIYSVLAEHTEIPVDWNAVKEYEIQMEKDAATVNPEMMEFVQLAQKLGKRVVVTCDSYFSREILEDMLATAGIHPDRIYIYGAADRTKSYGKLFERVACQEQVSCSDILHIGNGEIAEFENLKSQGVRTFHYVRELNWERLKSAPFSELDLGLYRILYNRQRGFWYNLGVEVGGPLYMGLYLWFVNRIKGTDKTVFFLNPTGYNLYQLLVQNGFRNVKFLYITEQDMSACDPENDAVKAEAQRDRILAYWDKEGFLSGDNIVFDIGGTGKTLYWIETLKQSIGCPFQSTFYLFGIQNAHTSGKWVHGRRYEAYAFDFYRNYWVLNRVENDLDKLFRLFFSAPYGENKDILDGIRAYLKAGLFFAQRYPVEYTPKTALGRFIRLCQNPTGIELLKTGGMGINVRHGGTHLSDPYYEQNRMNYQRWIPMQSLSAEKDLPYRPKFSVVVPVYNTASDQLAEAIESVLNQTYDNYELILVDDHSSLESVKTILQSYSADQHVKVIFRPENGHISAATNDGIQLADGEFIVFMDCDDLIEPDALYCFAEKLNEDPELDFLYSDEDKISEDGKERYEPHFKPDWSPDLLWSIMYTGHLAVYRRSIVLEIGGLRSAYDGSQDYDMTLRFMEKTTGKRVGHVPKILYHWRARRESVAFNINAKSYALDAACHAKQDALHRRGISGHVEELIGFLQYGIVYDPVSEPLVSIVIISDGNDNALNRCKASINKFTDYKNYEIIVANSREVTNGHKNYSAACNRGAFDCRGEYILFLYEDIEIFQPDWLSRMVGQAMQKETGAVSCKLLYPYSNTIHHGGIICAQGSIFYDYQFLDDRIAHGGVGYNLFTHNCLAVTGACMLVKKDIFTQVGGFDEEFPLEHGDVEFCFKLYENGYYNVIRNDVAAYFHREIPEDQEDVELEWLAGSDETLNRLFLKHPARKSYDPYLNDNLRSTHSKFEYKREWLEERFEPSKAHYSMCDGIYSNSGESYVWIMRKFRVRLKNERIRTGGLHIRLATWYDFYKQQNPDIEPCIRLLIDKKYIQDITVTEGYTEIIVPQGDHEGDVYDIELRANCSFVPKNIGTGDDIRELCMVIYYIGD